MIRRCGDADVPAMLAIINDAAEAYRGIIPADRWHEPYMPEDELRAEIAAGVVFWGVEAGGRLVGVMGLQDVRDVMLIRHAYVATAARNSGIGSRLLHHLVAQTDRPILVGTWADATWAIRRPSTSTMAATASGRRGRWSQLTLRRPRSGRMRHGPGPDRRR